MRVIFRPSHLRGSVTAPPSKSMAHRMLICAGLSDGTSTVRNISYSEDISATIDCLTALGASVKKLGDTVEIKGFGGISNSAERILNCRESGSTLRFFIPICLASGGRTSFCGARRLFERPLGIYSEICRERGIGFFPGDGGLIVDGRLGHGDFAFRGDVSSQFITGLLFALPLLDGDSSINITPPFESRAYTDMTLSALESFGVTAKRTSDYCFSVPGCQKYRPGDVTVEGDYSNAAFFEAMRLLGGDINICGLSGTSLQGDRAYLADMPEIAATFCEKDVSECPDLAPVYMALASACHGAVFTGTSRLRMKESDRGNAMAEELSKFGAEVTVGENSISVGKCSMTAPAAVLCSHNDHRIAMALSVLLSVTGGVLEGAEAVAKSFPEFFSVIKGLGAIFDTVS